MAKVLNPKKKYNLEYYLNVVDKLVGMGIHVLGIKDSKFFFSFNITLNYIY